MGTMLRRALLAISAVALAFAPLAASATPVVYTITDGGIDTGFICGTGAQCLSGTGTNFSYAPPAPPPSAFDPASGTLTLDTTAGTLAIAFSIASATFLDTAGAFNGVDEVEFTNVSYAGTLTVTNIGGALVVNPSQTVSVNGTYAQSLAGGSVVGPAAFSSTAPISSGQCLLVGNALNCGFDIGPGTFQLGIGSTPTSRRVLHTFNLVAVPEPSAALLLGLGLLGFGLRRRG